MELRGIPASPGIASGHAVVIHDTRLPPLTGPPESPAAEITRFQSAVLQTISELTQLQHSTRQVLGSEFAAIFRSQQTIVEDEDVRNSVVGTIHSDGVRAEEALRSVFEGYRRLFEELEEDAYNRSRLSDIQDVHIRMQRILRGVEHPDLSRLPSGAVLVAFELFPSDTAQIDARHVAGIVTEEGGAASHAAILAKSLGVPAVVRVSGIVRSVNTQDEITVAAFDAEDARVFVRPTDVEKRTIRGFERDIEAKRAQVDAYRGRPAVTTDGYELTVAVNIGSTQEIEPARNHGATAVGLYRSEFLFFQQPVLPDEEVQFVAYREAAEAFSEGDVVIRTLDIGGDKQLPALPVAVEPNPFLGKRAIRFSLAHPDLFKTQVRAILRAGAYGSVRMMFPMIGGPAELDRALSLVDECKHELSRDGIPFADDIPIGAMIEVPSAIWVADAIAQRVSFFSIGTNDLIQYVLAADRLNGDVAAYYQPYHPAVFRAIRDLTTVADRTGVHVAVCGEMGGDPYAIAPLAGLGVREFSVSANSLTTVTKTIRSSSMAEMEKVAREVLYLDSEADIKALLKEHYIAKE